MANQRTVSGVLDRLWRLLLRRLSLESEPTDLPELEPVDLSAGAGAFAVEVRGEARFQRILQRVQREAERRREAPEDALTFAAILVHERTNPYNAATVAVLSERHGCIGYLSDGDAAAMVPLLDRLAGEHKQARVLARLESSGGDPPDISVHLDLAPHGA